jgi:hypothetical protein
MLFYLPIQNTYSSQHVILTLMIYTLLITVYPFFYFVPHSYNNNNNNNNIIIIINCKWVDTRWQWSFYILHMHGL